MRVIHQGDKLAVAAHRLKRTSISDLSRILTTVFSSTDRLAHTWGQQVTDKGTFADVYYKTEKPLAEQT